jgi:dienelactone hydrolase
VPYGLRLGKPDKETLALFDYDQDAPLDVEEVDVVDRDGVSIIDITYASPAGGRVPAYLYVPTGDGPHAGIVVMHGMPGSRAGARFVAEAYARAGAVTVAISAPWARPDGPRDEIITYTEKDRKEQIQLIQDLRRAVDLLLEEPTVDPDRLGYVGGSYGGAMGGLLAGVEHRIKAFALAVGDGGLVAHSLGPEDRGDGFFLLSEKRRTAWRELMEPIEPLRFVGLAAPSHLLFQNGKTDQAVPAPDALLYQEAGSEPKTIKWYNSGHQMTPALLGDQARWMAERLQIEIAPFGLMPLGS